MVFVLLFFYVQYTLSYLLSVTSRFSKTDRGVIKLISTCDVNKSLPANGKQQFRA